MPKLVQPRSPAEWAILCVLIGALLHLILGFLTGFSVDEAHYALYADHLSWSYFDHPPMVGWIQWPFIQLGFSEGFVRVIPELLWIISCYLVYQITIGLCSLFHESRNASPLVTWPSADFCGLLAVLCLVVSPLPHVLAIGLLPDSLLTPLSLSLMLLSIKWITVGKFTFFEWILVGLLLGLSGLSKYTALFSAIALFLVLTSRPMKEWIGKSSFWLAVLIALVLISPVLYWNWANSWISFKYQIAHGEGGNWALRRVAAFLGIQFIAFGPLLFLGFFKFCIPYLRSANFKPLTLLSFFLIPFAIFAILSGGGGLPHWTTPAWYCLAPFAGIGLANFWSNSMDGSAPTASRYFIRLLIYFQAILCSVGFFLVIVGGISSTMIKSNPIADLYGWDTAGQKAAQLVKIHNADGIAVQNWTLASRIAWYARPIPVYVLDQRTDQFDLWFGSQPLGGNAILIHWSEMPYNPPILASTKPTSSHNQSLTGFEACRRLENEDLVVKRFGQKLSTFGFSLCRNWVGESQK